MFTAHPWENTGLLTILVSHTSIFIQGMLMFRRFHNMLLVSLSKNTKPSLSRITVQLIVCIWTIYQVMHSEILCFLDFLPFLLHYKVTSSLRICCCSVVWSGWQCVSRTGSDPLCKLPAARQLSWARTVEDGPCK